VNRWYVIDNPDDGHPHFRQEWYRTKRDAIAAVRQWCGCPVEIFRHGPGDYLMVSAERDYLGVQTGQVIIDRYGFPQR
jgi:hypothetical protein